jgi:hypothetical protein
VLRVDPVTGDRQIVHESGPDSGLRVPRDIAVESDGSLVVVDEGIDAVVRIDPATGELTTVSDEQQ